jgi:uncharacterized repeat protein (TIGR03803 family)
MPLKCGIAFLIMTFASLVGAQTIQTLCSFTGTNGAYPTAALTLGRDGNFYGTTQQGGITNSTYTEGMGTVFKMTTNGTLTTLVSLNVTNGRGPQASMTLGNDDNFYGTTAYGGSTIWFGTVFKVTTNGTLTTLVSLNSTNIYPLGGLTLGNDGSFYGTTYAGDSSGYPGGYGTVFKVTTNGALTTLVSFMGTNGANPQASLTLGSDGNFYGTTSGGGSTKRGTVFKVTTDGTLTTLVSFMGTNGANPRASMTLGSDGDFYGTTAYGGITNSTHTGGMGTVFKVTTNGTLTTLYSFTGGTNGRTPLAGLALGNDGNFYGTTSQGGITNSMYAYSWGTVFRLLLRQLLITVQPQSHTNNAGATATFLVSGRSLYSLNYQWQKNGTNLVDSSNISGATTNTLTITGISDADAASYSVIVSDSYSSATSSIATLTVMYAPSITAQPTNLLVLPGTNVAFSASLSGTALFLRYQWRFNNTSLLNATNAIFIIPSVGTNHAGSYSVVITNAAGIATSSDAALTVVVSPKSQTNYASSTATFSATAFSPESLNYQWQKNGTNLVNGGNLSGATNSTLTITSVSDADAAIYNAVVSDASGSVTTSNAVLTVNNFPFIASQPQSQTVVAGRAVTFNVTAYGAPPFVFQWYFKGTPVGSPTAGTNVSSYTLSNVGTNEAGNYSVQVVNGYSSVTSSNALLTVLPPPSLTLRFSAGYPLLNLYGMLGNNFVVEFNTNLAETNWINLLSLTNLSASPYQFLDPARADQPARFYRAFMQ